VLRAGAVAAPGLPLVGRRDAGTRVAPPAPAPKGPPPRPDAIALTGSASRSGSMRRLVHITTGILAWIAFVALWDWQINVFIPPDWVGNVLLVATIIFAWAAFTVLWVAWNRSIYRRRHRRTEPLELAVSAAEDSLGRPLVGAVGAQGTLGQIFISVDGEGRKHYRRAGDESRERG
jgi:hypothetical protein